jgi:hypothetical protein
MMAVSFGLSFFQATSKAKRKKTAEEEEEAFKAASEAGASEHSSKIEDWLRGTDLGKITVVFARYVGVILVGALFFFYSGAFEDIDSFVDAVFFATVVATTVGA